ncbi:MAG: hypothetical protein J6S11_04990 [Bacteroidaceae bacterium]|nr:hypothetical protein [Bacteroidaceae bacterium]
MKRSLFAIILLTTITFLSSAQEGDECSSIVQYARNILIFNREHPQEKVYLHMDNRSYFIGDTIWFKAYVMNASTLRPTETSGVLYVELLNDFGTEIAHRKLQIKDGMCHGEFSLDSTCRTGFYELRAYTRNMLNFGYKNVYRSYGIPHTSIEKPVIEPLEEPQKNSFVVSDPIISRCFRWIEPDEDDTLNADRRQGYRRFCRKQKKEVTFNQENPYIFSRVFPVYKRPDVAGSYTRQFESYPLHPKLARPKEETTTQRADNILLTLHPEGGMLIDGVESVVAFEATDQWGRKQNVCGRVEDSDGNIITTFEAEMRGRGVFRICPQKGKRYVAIAEYKGKEYRRSLLFIERQGYVIQLAPPLYESGTQFTVKASPNNTPELIGWTLQCRGALTASDTLSVAPGNQRTVKLPVDQLSGGVNQLTLYNIHGEVLADRLFWVAPHERIMQKAVVSVPDNVSSYERITLDIQLARKRKERTTGFLSIAVTDAAEQTESYDTRSMWSELLLSSELRGFIEDVDSYFHHDDALSMVTDLDLLMLVQGWRDRRYEWHTMAGREPYTPLYMPERSLGIDGYVIGEQYEPRIPTHITNNYPRIPHLAVNISLQNDTLAVNHTVYSDSMANFALIFDKPLYGRIPLTIKLEEIRPNMENRLWNSQIVINRSFAPQPKAFGFYETVNKCENPYLDTACIRLPQPILRESKLEDGIYIDRPEMIIDYAEEWNWIIDRGIPNENYRLVDDTIVHHRHYYLNFPYLSYSLNRMNNSTHTVIKEDSVFIKYRGAYYVPYTMPKRVKVYSNLLGRKIISNVPTKSPFNYLVVEHCTTDESPKRPPYLPNKGVRKTYFEGYSASHEFYSPDYSSMPLPDVADYRRTLYWNPNVETDDRGRSSITFYNNAHTKRFHIRAEGFTRNGEFIVYDSDKQNNETN